MLKLVGVIILCALLSACGFHLRGKVKLPDELKIVYIETKEHWLRHQITTVLKTSGAKIVNSVDKANTILTIYGINEGKIVRSVGGLGRVREYRLTYAVSFGVKTPKGVVLVPNTSVSRYRDYSFTEAEVVGKTVEEHIILQEMRREIVPDMMNVIVRKAKGLKKTSAL